MDYWTRYNQQHPYKPARTYRASSYRPCNRQGCRHDLSQHRQAQAPGGGIIAGACQSPHCLCSQYASESLVRGNHILNEYDPALGRR